MGREKGTGCLQQEKGGRWTALIRVGGKRYARSTRTTDRKQAERFLMHMIESLGLANRRIPLSGVWDEYVKSPNRNELAQATLNAKRLVWHNFAKWMEKHHLAATVISDVTSLDIGEYLAEIRTRLCASTYNLRVCILREVFRVVGPSAGMKDDPWKSVKLRPDDSHSRRELSKDEVNRLLEAAGKAGGEWRSLFIVGIYTGLRLGDCCCLKWESVDLVKGIVQLVPAKTRRHSHGKPVTIPMHRELRTMLESKSAERRNGDVLPEVAETYRTSRWRVSHEIAKVFKAANIKMNVKIEGRRTRTPEATFHSLRHTFVSLAANAGVPLHVVQTIVGHESTAMTRHYYHENIAALREAVDAIPTIDELKGRMQKCECESFNGAGGDAMLAEMRKVYEVLRGMFGKMV